MGQLFEATYFKTPPKQGPTLLSKSGKVGAKQLALLTNDYPQVDNDNLGWYANQTFGIQTADGFIGMTWEPDAGETRTLTPKLTFYISTGSFGSNELADWNQVSTTQL